MGGKLSLMACMPLVLGVDTVGISSSSEVILGNRPGAPRFALRHSADSGGLPSALLLNRVVTLHAPISGGSEKLSVDRDGRLNRCDDESRLAALVRETFGSGCES